MKLHLPAVVHFIVPVAALVLTLIVAGPAWGCACCAEPGQRDIGPAKIAIGGRAKELRRIEVAPTASLYMTACGTECVKGISDPGDSYAVSLSRDDTSWRFAFKGPQTKPHGTLVFDLPATLLVFAVDPTPEAGRHSPTLYREWRISAPVTGTGMFQPGMTGSPAATLILHGTGNACVQRGDFTHWSLIVSGPAADFTFFGPLQPQP